MTSRPLVRVPWAVQTILLIALAAQIALTVSRGPPQAHADALPEPPSMQILRVASLGDPIPLAQLLELYLQAFDNQPGISIPFADLDYVRVEHWLHAILELDPAGQYPLMMASQLYAQVPDEKKQRQMLDFVEREFLSDPDRRWPWLAHASIIAKHRLHDLSLALRYANILAEHAKGHAVPDWARQMHIFLHEDAGEYETARLLLGGLLASGAIRDPHEIRFLIDRLERIKAAEKSSNTSGK